MKKKDNHDPDYTWWDMFFLWAYPLLIVAFVITCIAIICVLL